MGKLPPGDSARSGDPGASRTGADRPAGPNRPARAGDTGTNAGTA